MFLLVCAHFQWVFVVRVPFVLELEVRYVVLDDAVLHSKPEKADSGVICVHQELLVV